MALWYKQIGDAPLPATKQLLLISYIVDTRGRGNAPVPVARAILLPPVASSAEEDNKDEVLVME